ncbi:hypothetical protein FLW53_09795 [Microbispora sp. SCL1-1]|uniref:hypothetical protein n=1 Tax=unclassified Microbispora TaxID=2614687 RepID=UPI00115A8682|nr:MULTISPECIES: hypothetical protein [unclassified Microbispora]NJP24499.1 hypothetical protein [Microbispora sp. CL1-1]TQS14643.1 hypothetical protein FLW53_09795 [Microbispora sp. SCL1-1]
MSQSNARAFRTETLVLTEDATPAAYVAEFLNNLTEGEERAQLAFFRSPEFSLFLACREIALDQDDEMGAAS